MAVGAIGNAIFVNQMTANASSIQNAHNNRIDFQNMVAQAAMQEKDEKVLEVRPAEETHKIDPDREHEKNSADQETARSEHDDKEDDDEEEKSPPLHKLDIKV
ncbi:hypothetical protein M947_08145 [Sulfurimonas hongkongensis]|uniref:Uncharacterized protein n=1 Tax=Sulfurimonas hongkongensis TaxID=1172190 RepID=T0JQJ9_9BACT|nr:hypothetical protein [Sulfurimonas hongkongensis]EQB39122.1 hypothetical protein M947_08145 [Sulfurimonas hongkongensis]